ncbi:MAG TPA: thioredoxin domain-containing protein [Candidatus Dormibacteraeota bacterium]|nr:thioredoxin domain-containing protein [Candidatus Dormibacteraeota bacterium]
MSARAVVAVLVLSLAGACWTAQAAHSPAGASKGAKDAAQQAAPADNQALLKTTESFVRELFAWGPNIPVKLGPLTQSAAADFYDVSVQVTLRGHIETGDVYVSKDGKTMLRGSVYKMDTDPFAENRAKIKVDGDPSLGPRTADVTLVEFSDFECPHCQELYEAMKTVETEYPQIRIVYKNYPLTQIHPWAETAAIGGRCAYEQSPAAFWKMESSIFDNQDAITPDNVWDDLVGYATKAGLEPGKFKACMASAEAKQAVEADHADGVTLGVDSTPTIYINGRPLIGGDLVTLEQYINFELAKSSSKSSATSR